VALPERTIGKVIEMNRTTNSRSRLQLVGFMGAVICGLMIYIAAGTHTSDADKVTPQNQSNFMQNEHPVDGHEASLMLI
jgi:hypothetical protein